MPQRKKQQPNQSRLKRLDSYRVFSVPVGSWLIIGILSALLAGGYYFFVLREYNAPTSKTFVAEVSSVWSQLYGSEAGGRMIYWVDLKLDDNEMNCRVAPIQVQLWHGLEIGRKYEFEVTLSQSRCFINGVTQIDEKGFSQ